MQSQGNTLDKKKDEDDEERGYNIYIWLLPEGPPNQPPKIGWTPAGSQQKRPYTTKRMLGEAHITTKREHRVARVDESLDSKHTETAQTLSRQTQGWRTEREKPNPLPGPTGH